jgi:hypothetical protein
LLAAKAVGMARLRLLRTLCFDLLHMLPPWHTPTLYTHYTQQERIMTLPFGTGDRAQVFKHSLFLVSCNRLVAACIAAATLLVRAENSSTRGWVLLPSSVPRLPPMLAHTASNIYTHPSLNNSRRATRPSSGPSRRCATTRPCRCPTCSRRRASCGARSSAGRIKCSGRSCFVHMALYPVQTFLQTNPPLPSNNHTSPPPQKKGTRRSSMSRSPCRRSASAPRCSR